MPDRTVITYPGIAMNDNAMLMFYSKSIPYLGRVGDLNAVFEPDMAFHYPVQDTHWHSEKSLPDSHPPLSKPIDKQRPSTRNMNILIVGGKILTEL
ncbi:hypothetical protein [Methylophaga lonarensis]|nr:hypothetical protein [Methylophaga lonarensis]